jgi:hypothetical protein
LKLKQYFSFPENTPQKRSFFIVAVEGGEVVMFTIKPLTVGGKSVLVLELVDLTAGVDVVRKTETPNSPPPKQ